MKRAALVLLLAAGNFAAAQIQPSGNAPDQDAFKLSVDVSLVVLQATVRDRLGHAVPDLTQQDFEVFEDGRPQPIHVFRHDDTPVTVGLVIDHSRSMSAKLADVTAGAQAFVHSSNTHDQMFVVNFNEKVTLGLPPGMRFSDSGQELGGAIWGAPAIGMTALYDGIVEALAGLRQGGSDKKVLVVISDGNDNASITRLDRVLQMAEQSSAMIYAIGLFEPGDPDANPKVLRRLAQETGGQAFFPDERTETVAICERIARDIRDQYTIGYSSTSDKRDGTYHKVRLTARANANGKLLVRTRAGYIAGAVVVPGSHAATQ